jgi:hypothetical protein
MKFSNLCLGLLVLSAAACKQNREIKVYRVDKEAPLTPSQPAAAAEPHAGVPGIPSGSAGDPHAGLTAEQLAVTGPSGGPQITDSPPAHWKKMPATSMRQASYLVEGEGGAVSDISLVILRGAAGGILDNVNRWRGQLAQPAIDEAALRETSKTITTYLGEAVVVEIEGLAPGADAAKDGRMMGVIANKGADAWFYKMRGNSVLTTSEKENFIKWVQSVKPATETAAAPASIPPAAPSNDGSLSWQLPADWTPIPTTSSMRYATFGIADAGGAKAEMAITHFPGDVGGDLENVNRWRQQVGLPAVGAAGLPALVSQLTAGAKTVSLIDITGPQNRLVAGWTRHGSDTWFFKLTGPDALVGAEKAKFTDFLESVRFNKPE